MRRATVERQTRETQIRLLLDLDDPTPNRISSGLPFFDHMLQSLQHHGRLGLEIAAQGDDPHHLIEDVGITLGQALKQTLSQGMGFERYGEATVPMDESLVQIVLDLSGRPYLAFTPEELAIDGAPGGMNAYLLREFLRGLVNHAGITLHLRLLAGREAHHVLEASFKALGRALHQATRLTRSDLPSTKGLL
jgi:imidazoleglycerol-phosphate dehydratase